MFAVLLHLVIYKVLQTELTYSRFCLTFCCHDNQDRSSINLTDIIGSNDPDNHLFIHKHLGNIRAISDFVSNFVAMTTGLAVVEFV